MTLGPPSSAAGPSNNATPESSKVTGEAPTHEQSSTTSATHGPSVQANVYTTQFAAQPQSAYYATSQFQTGANQPTSQFYPAQATYYQQPLPASAQHAGNYQYYGYPPNAWANAWNATAYQHASGSGYSYAYAPLMPGTPQTAIASSVADPVLSTKKSPSPSPSPAPEYHKDWDAVLKSFLTSLGFCQALRGFEADMLVMNPDWERSKVPVAIRELMKNLAQLNQEGEQGSQTQMYERPLNERKLSCVHRVDGAECVPHSSITKDISRFLAQNRARNDASNRNEFLLSVAEKRRRLNEHGDFEPSAISSCARTDAKTQNRDLQMKYDIAKNEDGPLRRTMKAGSLMGSGTSEASTQVKSTSVSRGVKDILSAEQHPGLDERFQNIEKHLAVRYVPSPPRSLLDRLRYLEDHIIYLEREYPPWAALHFSQPNRGWPPPPRATPIIVPSHLTSTAHDAPQSAIKSQTGDTFTEGGTNEVKGKPGRRAKSSLHRAVMEKLEVQRAINDLAGDGG